MFADDTFMCSESATGLKFSRSNVQSACISRRVSESCEMPNSGPQSSRENINSLHRPSAFHKHLGTDDSHSDFNR